MRTRWSTQWIGGYDRSGILHGHILWHQALGALEHGDAAQGAGDLCGCAAAHGTAAPPLNAMSDCASLLWRLKAYGHAVPQQLWDDADAYARRTFPKLSLPFVEMHMALLAAATGNHAALDERLRSIEQRLADGKLPAGPVVPQHLSGDERVCARGLCRLRRQLEACSAMSCASAAAMPSARSSRTRSLSR